MDHTAHSLWVWLPALSVALWKLIQIVGNKLFLLCLSPAPIWVIV